MSPDKDSLKNYARYSSLAIQMLVIIFLGVFGGYKLDQWLETKPLFTVILSLSGVTVAIYQAVKDFIKIKK